MDNDRPASVSVLKDFVGLVSDVDPCDAPNGAMTVQVNMFSLQVGVLEPRSGLKEVTLTYLE